MARANGSMRRRRIAGERGLGIEEEQHAALANPEEHMPPRLLGGHVQPQDFGVEPLDFVEILGVKDGFDDPFDLRQGRHLPLPRPRKLVVDAHRRRAEDHELQLLPNRRFQRMQHPGRDHGH